MPCLSVICKFLAFVSHLYVCIQKWTSLKGQIDIDIVDCAEVKP